MDSNDGDNDEAFGDESNQDKKTHVKFGTNILMKTLLLNLQEVILQ